MADPNALAAALAADIVSPLESIPVNRINEMYTAHRQHLNDRIETASRGFDSVFAQ
ncbi:MAG: hypothetical protein M1829_002776 [Trizodia sp. TS-e1964]|nr:MAG: hypothetical protein M1829_002776 [Trizodia sp. TS-e1964]